MLNGSELSTAIAAVLVGAVCVGFLLHWLWTHLGRSRTGASARLDEMAERLHEADTAREAAEARLAHHEAEAVERLEAMLARLDGTIDGREAELARGLEAMRAALSEARRRVSELEAEIEKLRAAAR